MNHKISNYKIEEIFAVIQNNCLKKETGRKEGKKKKNNTGVGAIWSNLNCNAILKFEIAVAKIFRKRNGLKSFIQKGCRNTF